MRAAMTDLYRLALALALIGAPLAAFWTIEISVASGPYPMDCRLFGRVSNGFWRVDGCLAYHAWLYVLLLVNVGAALQMILGNSR